MKAKEPRINVRVSQELRDRLDRVCAETKVGEADIVRGCLEALCDHVEETGSITFPIAVTTKPKKLIASAATPLRLPATDALILNDPTTPYRKNKPTKP